MIRSKTKSIPGLIALALVACGLATSKAIEQETNGWINLGPDGAGGSIIYGPAGSEGQLGVFTNIPLSENGHDVVVLAPGGVASSPGGATIEFESNVNGFENFGTVNGPVNDEGVFQNTGVGFFTGSTMFAEGVLNNHIIAGGEGNGGFGIIGAGIGFWSDNGIFLASVVNNGLISGGSVSSGDDSISIGTAIVVYDNSGLSDINGLYLRNSGSILGGTSVNNAVMAGNGFSAISLGNVQNVFVLNQAGGLIAGGNDSNTGFVLGSGVALVAGPLSGTSFLNGVSMINAGNILGGNNADHTNLEFAGNLNIAGTGVALWGGNGVYNVYLNNSGNIFGGSSAEVVDIAGNESTDPGFGSAANTGLAIFDANGNINRPGDINGVVLINSGTITGGNNGGYAFIVSTGVGIAGEGNVANVAIKNTSTGVILGGNGGAGADFFPGSSILGTGIGVAGDINSGTFSVSNVGILNNGFVGGGNDNNNEEGTTGGIVGAGIGIWSGNGVYNVSIVNNNTVIGGNDNFSETEGAIIGDGIGVSDANFRALDINGVTIFNNGTVIGGNDNSDARGGANSAGVGIAVTGGGNMANVTVLNNGIAIGGNGNGFATFAGDGIAVGTQAFSGTNANIYVINTGIAQGGNNEGEGENGGAGIHMIFRNIEEEGSPADSNIHIVNTGLAIGGNGSEGGASGIGIDVQGNNVVIDNWGVAATGAGTSGANVKGFPGVAIRVTGNNNVINLNGHSTVLGTIQGINVGNNVLNLNFSGLSPTAIQNLKNQLMAQGWPGTNNFSGTFTVRQVTYFVDPIGLGLNASSYQLQGITPNQQSVGANLDGMQVNPTGDMLKLVNAIDQSGNVPLALEALSPQPYQIYGDIAEGITTFNTLEVDQRLNNLRDGSEFVDTTGMGGGSDQTTAGFSKDGKDGKGTIQMNPPERRWGFFATGSGLFTNIDAHGGDLTNAGFTTSGLILGVDGKINDHFVAGLLFNYNHTTADLDNAGSKSNIDTVGGGLYAGYHDGGWYANTLATFDHNSYDSTRNILIPGFNRVAIGSTSGNQYAFDIDGGYDFHLSDRLSVGPVAGLQYMHLDVDGFNEAGAGAANLAVGSQDVNSLRSRIGVHADYHLRLNKEVVFGTEVHAEWQHEFLDDSRTISAAFIGANLGNFGVRTTAPERDSAILGVGANFTVHDRATFYVDYDAQVGQSSYMEHSIKGGLKLSF